ncbi:MAG TPA: hypothetical protein DEB40_00515 [Elusimicrobia bacterium]|nr:hypothetical protein [Elusimicrobiota bacterium]HBT60214.1 hypothetical protein [Elusimicrobiota bacterium]
MATAKAGQPIDILLVEDNPGDARIIREMLRDYAAGAQLAHAASLGEGLARLEREPCDVILVDLKLPDESGLDTFAKVHEKNPLIPIIVLTGNDDDALAVEAVRKGAQDYIPKNQMNGKLLATAISYAIERKRAHAEICRLNQELKTRLNQLQVLVVSLAETERRERRRLAGLLHDHLQQQLTAAIMHLGFVADNGLSEADIQENVAAAYAILKEAGESTRSLSYELSPPILHRAGFGAALKWLAGHMHRTHKLKVELEIDPATPELAELPRSFLFDAVRELLFNVVKHAKAGKAKVIARSQAGNVLIEVSDEGAGFDPSSLRPENGGLGLASIRERLELLYGRLEIDSRPGGGSRFILIAPCQPAKAPDAAAQSKTAGPQRAGTDGCAVFPSNEPLKIILVDDQLVIRQGLAALLSKEPDIEVVGEAGDGRQALELCEKLRPNLVAMDLAMPGMDGIEATKLIKGRWPETRVIVLTMHGEEVTAELARKSGADAFIDKAEAAERLLSAIRRRSP